jgi:hypothetical protein
MSRRHQGTKTKETQAKRMKSRKLDDPVLDSGGSSFLRIVRVQLSFEIYFV